MVSDVGKKVTQEKTSQLHTMAFLVFIYSSLIVDLVRISSDQWLHLPPTYITIVRNSIYIPIALYVFVSAWRNHEWHGVLFLAFVYLLSLFVSILIDDRMLPLAEDTTLLFFSRSLPAYYLARHEKDWPGLMKKNARFFPLVITYAIIKIAIHDDYSYSMSAGYNLLIPSMLMLFATKERKSVIALVGFLSCLFAMVMVGSRGPVLCVGLSVLTVLLVSKRTRVNILVVISTVFFLLFMVFALRPIIDYFYTMNPNSRTLNLLMRNEFFYTSGRDAIYEIALSTIRENPFLPHGILMDRVIISTYLSGAVTDGLYAHNIILELFVQYGVIIGFVITLTGVVNVYKAFRKLRMTANSEEKFMFCVLFGYAFASLMVSGSYLTSIALWMLMGCTMNIQKQHLTAREKNEARTVLAYE